MPFPGALACFPQELVPSHTWYAYVDALILAGMLRDWLMTRRMHPVYAIGLSALVLGQMATMWILISKAAWWWGIANRLL
ncbi:hypothetical protein [Dyella subtropica]|uniref:hypothetical protein n=1 Tax=Dyella subtropica TaxID=2992127 RepID=UPI002251F36C|nr:hypothetical protein [Dyella subtropica]